MKQREFVFAGLGNPGQRYEKTRHNMGYLVVSALAQQMGWHFKEEKRCHGLVAKGIIEGHLVHLLLPTTYMNASGQSIRCYLDYFKLNPCNLVVIVDEIALPFGQLRLRLQGSAGGHNGLKSVEAHLGTSDYIRLRMGIGHPGERGLSDYVLGTFSQEELEHLENFVNRGVEILRWLLKEEVAQGVTLNS